MEARRLIRRSALAVARRLLGVVLATPGGVRAVNVLHRALPLYQKRRCYFLFVDAPYRPQGRWKAGVAGRSVILPLRRDVAVSWVNALAFHGLDTEIHVLYEALLRAPCPPRVFFDVGANYGVHALKFLAHGARVVAFEPNPACHEYLRAACALNGFQVEIEAVALADRPGRARLWIPGDQTYMATIVPQARTRWISGAEITTLEVAQTTLDDFVAARHLAPDVVKIDAEGSEPMILAGARTVLATARPRVVFESWRDDRSRDEIFSLLDAAGYALVPLTFPAGPGTRLDRAGFLDAAATNFLARPLPGGASLTSAW